MVHAMEIRLGIAGADFTAAGHGCAGAGGLGRRDLVPGQVSVVAEFSEMRPVRL